MSCDGPASHHDKEIEQVEKVPNVAIQRPNCSDCLELPEIGKKRNNYAENDFVRTVTKIDGAVARMERMQHSAFWLFLWNDVYKNDETEDKIERKKADAAAALAAEKAKEEAAKIRVSTTRGGGYTPCAVVSAPVVVPAPILDNAVTRTMMTNFETVKIALRRIASLTTMATLCTTRV